MKRTIGIILAAVSIIAFFWWLIRVDGWRLTLIVTVSTLGGVGLICLILWLITDN
jgi:hypothetical protein